MHAQDCFIVLIDPSGKSEDTFCYHRVWNKELFINSRREYFANHRNESERRNLLECSKRQFDRKAV